jgi:hypothetical protein
MSSETAGGTDDTRRREVRVGGLLGRRVLAANNRSIGRLEEFRVEKRDAGWVVSEYLIGVGGLAERLGVGVRLLFGRRVGVRVARWDQLDISDPYHPRLTCPVGELREE